MLGQMPGTPSTHTTPVQASACSLGRCPRIPCICLACYTRAVTKLCWLQGAEKSCRARCQEDLLSTTRYVTWSLHTGQRATLKSMLSKVQTALLE